MEHWLWYFGGWALAIVRFRTWQLDGRRECWCGVWHTSGSMDRRPA